MSALTRFLLDVEPEPTDVTTIGLVGVADWMPVALQGVDLNTAMVVDGEEVAS